MSFPATSNLKANSEQVILAEVSSVVHTKKIKKEEADVEIGVTGDSNDHLTDLPLESLYLILHRCDATAIIALSRSCRKLYNCCVNLESLWKTLCKKDFDVYLTSSGPFMSYFDIYRLLYCSRILLGSYIYVRYFNKLKLTQVPVWLLTWASLSRQSPLMKYGRHRIKRRTNGHYLKRLRDISYGQIRKVFDLKSFNDVIDLYPTRVERGTIYFSWQAIRYAGMRKHGGKENYEAFLMKKCYRARGFIERNYQRVQGSDPLRHL